MFKRIIGLLLMGISGGLVWESITQPMPNGLFIGIAGAVIMVLSLWMLRYEIGFTTIQKHGR